MKDGIVQRYKDTSPDLVKAIEADKPKNELHYIGGWLEWPHSWISRTSDFDKGFKARARLEAFTDKAKANC